MYLIISDDMRLGIIAEGKADIAVIKAVLKALKGIDGSDVNCVPVNSLTKQI